VAPERFQIDAADISARALARAERGVYGKNSFRGKDLAFRDRYFQASKEGFVLDSAVRSCVRFYRDNLFSDDFLPGHASYDFIFCRNVMIYFDRPTQETLVRLLAEQLVPGGHLLVGHSESLSGVKHTLKPAEMGFSYRKSNVPDDLIFVEAVFEGMKDEPAAVRTRMEELLSRREESQPIKSKTGGSTFKNPPGAKAWKLIEDAGCRGLKHGDAMVSDVHCNFLINLGGASAADIEALGEQVRAKVKEQSGVELEWEIKRVGVP